MDKMVTAIVGGLVVFILAAALVPTAITAIKGANTTGWSTAEVAIWGTLGVFFLIGILLGVVYMFIKRKG